MAPSCIHTDGAHTS